MTDESGGVAPLQAAAANEDMPTNLRYWQELLRSQERTIVCGPEVEDAVRQAIEQRADAGLFKVQASDVIPDGTVIVVNEHAIEASMRMRLGEELRPVSHWQTDYRAIAEATWRGEFRGGPPQDAAPVAPGEEGSGS